MTEKEVDVSEFHKHYIDTLVAVKTGLQTIADGQKMLYDHISRDSDEQTKIMINMAADIRVMRERFANIELRSMMVSYKKNGDTNGATNGKGNNGNGKPEKEIPRKDITAKMDEEEAFDHEMMYRYIGKFISNNWKFIAIVCLLAAVGAIILFLGPEWANWIHSAPIKKG